jgi:DinB superfamily
VNRTWREIVWNQYGAAIDTLESVIVACPDALWGDRSQRPEYWYIVYHTLFFLDFYLHDSKEPFAPPAPFNLDELDPAGILPDRVYTKDEMRRYLEHGREKLRLTLVGMTDEKAGERRKFGSLEATCAEGLLYTMRHMQHHSAQLILILRQQIDSTPGWVGRTKRPLGAG